MPSGTAVLTTSVVAAAVLGVLFYLQPWADAPDPAPVARTAASAGPSRPSTTTPAAPKVTALYCQFYVFVESRPFVAFLFERAADERPVYAQAYVAKADGHRTDYNAATGQRPEWRFDASADPPRLSSRVMVPNSSQAGVGEEDIAIEVYGFDGTRVADVWYEASLKSVYYQNLPGKCRQTAA